MPSRCGQEKNYILFLSLVYLDFFFTFVILLRAIIYCSYMQRNCPIVNSDLLGSDAVLLA
jgi:hypothetical protein